MSKLEKEIQASLIKIARNHTKVKKIIRTNCGRVKGKGGWFYGAPEGWTDLTGYTINGQLIGIEMKRPDTKKNTSDAQKSELNDMKESNCICGVAYDKESLLKILDSIE